MKFLGFNLYVGDFSEVRLGTEPLVINTLNPHSYVVAKEDAVFHSALSSSDYLVPDGVGVVLAARFFGSRISRMSGFRLFHILMRRAVRDRLSVMFVGSSPRTLHLLESRLKEEYPAVRADFYSPPYADHFSAAQNEAILSFVNERRPDILFVGMTAPKQEKWVFSNCSKIRAGAVACIGAVFNFYAGDIKRPSRVWRRLGLEWLRRLAGEPRRLWRRTLVSAPLFFLDVIRARLLGKPT